MRLFICIILVLFPVMLTAQDKGHFSVELGFQRHIFSMNRFNDFLLSPYSYNQHFYITPPEDQINAGNGYDLVVKYQPFSAIDVGVYGGFQSGKIRKPINYYLIDIINMDTTIFNGAYRLDAMGFTVGVVSNVRINELLNFSEKEGFLKSFLFGTELRVGAGYAHLRDVAYFNDPPFLQELYAFGHSAWSGHGQLALKAGYSFSDRVIRSTLNFKLGYQYFATPNLKRNNGTGFEYGGNNPKIDANLDFSGLFFSVSIEIGK